MSKNKDKSSLIHPKNYPAWLGVALLWLATFLPDKLQIYLGIGLGKLIFLFGGKLKKNTLINLKLCFPELTQKEQEQLARDNFKSLGIGLIEAARAFWLTDKKLANTCELIGSNNLENALKLGRGVLLISPHFTCLEIVGRVLSHEKKFAVMFRPHKKPVLEYIHKHFRNRHYSESISSRHMRKLLDALKSNLAIWYAYDIDGGRRKSVFAPFFNIQTASLTSVSRLVEKTGAAVVPIYFHRTGNSFKYKAFLGPSLTDFPTSDRIADAARLNALLESAVRAHPEQYIWQYQRFKTRPDGEERFY